MTEPDCDLGASDLDPVEQVMLDHVPDDGDWRSACARAVAAHPHFEAELRRRFELLAGVGLLPTKAAEEADLVAAEADDLVGFRIVRSLGSGGMGAVFLAEQQVPARGLIAVKIIKPGMDSAALVARFQAEHKALARMDHTGIARIHEVGTTSHGRPYFVMEYVDGEPIDTFAARWKLSVRERVGLLASIADAVQHAHERGVVHRDLKPGNVLVAATPSGPVAKVIDFGLAKALHGKLADESLHTATGAALGTPAYMSPEQARKLNWSIDERTDVYALGVMLFELLTGTRPPSPEPHRLPRRPSRMPGVPPEAAGLDAVVMRALAWAPSSRYPSAAEFRTDLANWLDGRATTARLPSIAARAAVHLRRHRAGVVSVGAVLGAFLVGALALGGGPPMPPVPREPVEPDLVVRTAAVELLRAPELDVARADELLARRADLEREIAEIQQRDGVAAPPFPVRLVSSTQDERDANRDSGSPAISADGRYVAFASDATNLVSDDTNGVSDVFRKDLWTGDVLRISVDSHGRQATGPSRNPVISGDGRLILFESAAPDLTEDTLRGYPAVFSHDVVSGLTRCVSVAPGEVATGLADGSAISADGRHAAFATKELTHFPLRGLAHAVVRDLATGELELLARSPTGAPANGPSWGIHLSADGMVAAFCSEASNLALVATTGAAQIYVRDRRTGTTTLVSCAADGTPANRGGSTPRLSPDGHRVLFSSRASNLAPGTDGKAEHLYLRDLQEGWTRCLSADPSGRWQPNRACGGSFIASGDRLVFTTDAALVEEDGNREHDVYVYDVGDARLQRVTRGLDYVDTDGSASACWLAADAGVVVFASAARNMLRETQHARQQRIFAIDLRAAPAEAYARLGTGPFATRDVAFVGGPAQAVWRAGSRGQRLCQRSGADVVVVLDGKAKDGGNGAVSVSVDGGRIAFGSDLPDLVPGEPNEGANAFVLHRGTGRVERVSVTADGRPLVGDSGAVRLSGDGRVVVFVSAADGAVAEDRNGRPDVFRRELDSGHVDWLSQHCVLPSTPGAIEDLLFDLDRVPAVSHDGSRVLFQALAPVSGNEGPLTLWLWDDRAGLRCLVARDSRSTNGAMCHWPQLSGDGSTYAFSCADPHLVTGLDGACARIFVGPVDGALTCLTSPTSDRRQGDDWFVRALSRDGRFLVFESRDPGVLPGNPQGVTDVYRVDRASGEILRLTAAGAWRANHHSHAPVVSDDGRFVAFHTHASNLEEHDENGPWFDAWLVDVDRHRAVPPLPRVCWSFADAAVRHRHQSLVRTLELLGVLQARRGGR